METKENKMGTMAEGKLLATMAIPMMISMLLQALYNVVDSYFVSRVSQDAFNALSLAFPLQSLMIGLGAGTGLGVNALISRSLGERRQDIVVLLLQIIKGNSEVFTLKQFRRVGRNRSGRQDVEVGADA